MLCPSRNQHEARQSRQAMGLIRVCPTEGRTDLYRSLHTLNPRHLNNGKGAEPEALKRTCLIWAAHRHALPLIAEQPHAFTSLLLSAFCLSREERTLCNKLCKSMRHRAWCEVTSGVGCLQGPANTSGAH